MLNAPLCDFKGIQYSKCMINIHTKIIHWLFGSENVLQSKNTRKQTGFKIQFFKGKHVSIGVFGQNVFWATTNFTVNNSISSGNLWNQWPKRVRRISDCSHFTSGPGCSMMMFTMDNFCSYFFVPLLLFGIWCLFEDEDNFCIKLLVLLTLICNVDWSFLSFF